MPALVSGWDGAILHFPLNQYKVTTMITQRFIDPQAGIRKHFSSTAFAKADRDMFEFFMTIFSEARQIAAEESGNDVNLQIDMSAWTRAYWYILRRRRPRGRHQTWTALLRFSEVLIPIGIGWGLSDLASRH